MPLKHPVMIGPKTGGAYMPYTSGGAFQLNWSGNQALDAGFVWLFTADGAKGWGTHIHGTEEIQAVSFASNRLRLMGLTTYAGNTNVQATCNAVSGALSICGGDDEILIRDHYIAEFGLASKELKWSTVLSGGTDGAAASATLRYSTWTFVPYDVYRVMDIRSNADGYFMVMGKVGQIGEGQFPTIPANGMYHKPFNTAMGEGQSEVFIALYTPQYERIWTTMFGSEFDHISNGPPGNWDFQLLPRGSDFGHDILWVHQEVLYLVGSTGGYQMHRECPFPFPGPSYCEATSSPLISDDTYDGMIARFDLRDLVHVDVAEGDLASSTALQVFPSPTEQSIRIIGPSSLSNGCVVSILDLLGKLVLDQTNYSPGCSLDISGLASGSYQVVLRDPTTGVLANGQFIRR